MATIPDSDSSVDTLLAGGESRTSVPTDIQHTHHVADISAFLRQSHGDPLKWEERQKLEPALRAAPGPVSELSLIIREVYWKRLIRSIDATGIDAIFRDSKRSEGERLVYVPHDDPDSLTYFRAEAEVRRNTDRSFEVVVLPSNPNDPVFVRSIEGRPGILSLGVEKNEDDTFSARPFVVPGGRFNEMYGWDSAFIAMGLIECNRVQLAKAMVMNQVYQIKHYGQVLNANRSYYLTRSQPPVLIPMAEEVFAELERTNGWTSTGERQLFLEEVIRAAVREYREVWTGPYNLDVSTGLSRYFDPGIGFCNETEPGHFDSEIASFVADSVGVSLEKFLTQPAELQRTQSQNFIDRFNAGKISSPEVQLFIEDDRSMRASGHDTSYRLVGKASRILGADLNSLLYGTERGIARLAAFAFPNGQQGTLAAEFESKAATRRAKMSEYLWDDEAGTFLDFDRTLTPPKKSPYLSASSFFALYSGVATEEQARAIVHTFLPKLEMPGGIMGCTEDSRGPLDPPRRPLRQWDAPFGWAPHQIAVWRGLLRYGYQNEAQRLAYKWLYMVNKESETHKGAVAERYDVMNAKIFEGGEYGAQGMEQVIDNGAGFGWTNASFEIGRSILSAEQQVAIDKGVSPDQMFPSKLL